MSFICRIMCRSKEQYSYFINIFQRNKFYDVNSLNYKINADIALQKL